MAEPNGKRKRRARRSTKQDAVVELLGRNPAVAENAALLGGFLGKADQPERWRLYLSLEMSHYAEFDADAVLASRELSPDESSLGGTLVWLQGDAPVRYVQSRTTSVQADFLSGEVAAGALGRTTRAGTVIREDELKNDDGYPHTNGDHTYSIIACASCCCPTYIQACLSKKYETLCWVHVSEHIACPPGDDS